MLLLLVLACTPLVDTWSGAMECADIDPMNLILTLTDETSIQRSEFSSPSTSEDAARAGGNLDNPDDGGAARPRDTGTGTLDCAPRENDVPCKETFDVTVTRASGSGEQALEIVFDDCNGQVGNAVNAELDCGGIWDATWDGADIISGTWDDCPFDLSRVAE